MGERTLILPLGYKALLLHISGMGAANLLSQIPYAFCDISRVVIVRDNGHSIVMDAAKVARI
jgi:hypothetical protein